MATFNTFLDTLPDPDISIGDAGQAGGTAGQGFAEVSLRNAGKIDSDITIGGKLIRRKQQYPMWSITLNYNPMTEEQFKPVYSFLMQKQGGLRPFFVELPQYKLPKNTAFATYVDSSNVLTTTSAGNAGQTSIEITETGVDTTIPMFGDLFHIEDSNDSFHTKAYMIDRVETASSNVTPPSGGSIRIHFTPGLHRDVSSGAEVVFKAPKIFVRQMGGLQSYELNNDGLYVFSLALQEVSY